MQSEMKRSYSPGCQPISVSHKQLHQTEATSRVMVRGFPYCVYSGFHIINLVAINYATSFLCCEGGNLRILNGSMIFTVWYKSNSKSDDYAI